MNRKLKPTEKELQATKALKDIVGPGFMAILASNKKAYGKALRTAWEAEQQAQEEIENAREQE